MEQNFQTSFIPKKPIIEDRFSVAKPVSLLTVTSIFLLFTVLLASGGLYFYRGVLNRSIASMENDLNLAKNRFEPAKIAELEVLDRRLGASTEVLSRHIALTPVFEALQDLTMKTVRYTKFAYSLGTGDRRMVTIKIEGQAIGYRSIALQSDLFTKNPNLIDPVFSNLSLDDRGNVIFNLEFSVDPSFVDYRQMLQKKTEGATRPVGDNSFIPPSELPAS